MVFGLSSPARRRGRSGCLTHHVLLLDYLQLSSNKLYSCDDPKICCKGNFQIDSAIRQSIGLAVLFPHDMSEFGPVIGSLQDALRPQKIFL